MREYTVEQDIRNSTPNPLGGETGEIQRMIIARARLKIYDQQGGVVMKNKGIVFLGFVFVLLGSPAESYANKSSVEIEAPEVAEKNSEIVIKIHVFHKGNNFIHYTNWVDVKINGKPFQRWEFSASNRPDAEDFTREITYKLTEPITIVAEANCNTHGSDGSKTWTVTLAPEENAP